MKTLYGSIKTDLVDPELEAKVNVEVHTEPQLAEVPDNLYSAIVSNTPEIIAEVEVNSTEARQYAYTVPHRLYSLLVPEKPSILAEERIFVYVPKVTATVPGIAKFATEQFNVINGEVSVRDSYLNKAISTGLINFDIILVVNELPLAGVNNRIYLVPINASTSNGYIWDVASSSWLLLGSLALNMNEYYTKLQVDALLHNINLSLNDYYTRAQIDNLLAGVTVDLTNYYTKSEINTIVNNVSTKLQLFTSFEEADQADLPENSIVLIELGTI